MPHVDVVSNGRSRFSPLLSQVVVAYGEGVCSLQCCRDSRIVKYESEWKIEVESSAERMTLERRDKAMKTPHSIIAGAALITGFVFGSMFHTPKVQARNHLTAHIEQVSQVPNGRQTNGTIAGFSCASSGGEEPKCFALIVSPD